MSSKIFVWNLNCLGFFTFLCQHLSRWIQTWEKHLSKNNLSVLKTHSEPHFRNSGLENFARIFFFLFPSITLLASLHAQLLHTGKGIEGVTLTAHPAWFCTCSPTAQCLGWALLFSNCRILAGRLQAPQLCSSLPEELIQSPEKSTQRSPWSSLCFKSCFSTIPFQKGGTGTNFPYQLVWELCGEEIRLSSSASVCMCSGNPHRRRKRSIILAPVNDFWDQPNLLEEKNLVPFSQELRNSSSSKATVTILTTCIKHPTCCFLNF